MERNINEILAKMTLEEKAGLCSGADVWRTKAVERLGIPSIVTSDGPHGLRCVDEKGDLSGTTQSLEEVCFPTASATACSFDRELIEEMGRAIGLEAQSEKIHIVLGPGANIKRSPLCGRNFEYYSEDPYVSSEMAASLISGIQSEGAGACIKHFAVNNQEERRMSISAELSERALREIYLAAFEGAVKKAKPVAIMSSYNRINGTYASENPHILTDILRGEWGYNGFVVTDWGAINDRVAALKAGLDLEMPYIGPENDEKIVAAVRDGLLDETVLDRVVERILKIVFRLHNSRKATAPYDREEHHALARKVAADCIVLLKNEDHILPLTKSCRTAFIGEFAKNPRYQGNGSSHINAIKVAGALEAMRGDCNVTFAQGYDETGVDSDLLIEEACQAAREADCAVIFAGLPESFDSEGYDRRHLKLPEAQDRLIEAVAGVQANTVVVLHNGAPVLMPWLDKVKAVLEAYLGGQAVGAACVDVLYGEVNPSGKLAETFPLRLQDTPAYLNFPGSKERVHYDEGVFVGYRYYDSREMDVLFPFGHGLSYTTFKYSNLSVEDTGDNTFTIRCLVKNTGSVTGKEVVQLYVGNHVVYEPRPAKELRGFKKIDLKPGEEAVITFFLSERDFCYYDEALGRFHADNGTYAILVGSSSQDIRLRDAVEIKIPALAVAVTMQTLVFDIINDDRLWQIFGSLVERNSYGLTRGMFFDKTNLTPRLYTRTSFIENVPLRSLPVFCNGAVTASMLETAISEANRKI